MKLLIGLLICFLTGTVFGADGYLARTNGNIVIGPGGSGGSQTPWTGDIDGGNHQLTNTSGLTTTNLTVNGAGNNFMNALNVSSNLYITNLTASRLVLSDANKSLASAAASGAVPVNADGSAATTLTSKTNSVTLGTGITTLDFVSGANTTVTGAVSGATATIGISSSGGGSSWVKQSFAWGVGASSQSASDHFLSPMGIGVTQSNPRDDAIAMPFPTTGGYISNFLIGVSAALPSGTNVTSSLQTNVYGLPVAWADIPITVTLLGSSGVNWTNSGTASWTMPTGSNYIWAVRYTPSAVVSFGLYGSFEWWHQ
jgi:hypothetical protein